MKVTYVRGWTSPVCDVKLSRPQKRPYSYTRRRANVIDVLSSYLDRGDLLQIRQVKR